MRIGPAARRLLPGGMERRLAGVYRRVFVDLAAVAARLADEIPLDAKVLDIGGGDGELLNHLFAVRPDLRVTMVDTAENVGRFLLPEHRGKVALCPRTSIEVHATANPEPYDVALISDVMHHLQGGYRPQFLKSVHATLAQGGRMFVKDVEPGHFIAWLGLFCDRYLSGDRGVALVSRSEFCDLARKHLPVHAAREVGLFAADRPNYLVQLDFYTPRVPA